MAELCGKNTDKRLLETPRFDHVRIKIRKKLLGGAIARGLRLQFPPNGIAGRYRFWASGIARVGLRIQAAICIAGSFIAIHSSAP